jgi:molybdate transport system regulatory protein
MPDAPRLSLRIDLPPNGRIGPGKIALLEHIAATGSISAAAREMKMSYRQAWSLVEELTQLFGRPVILAQKGGPGGGGAELTALGLALVTRYRAVERAATMAAQAHLDALAQETDAG